MAETVPFREQGCKYCREYWISTSDQPKLIGSSLEFQCQVFRCDVCGSWWEYGLNYPHVVEESTALQIAATVQS